MQNKPAKKTKVKSKKGKPAKKKSTSTRVVQNKKAPKEPGCGCPFSVF